MKIAQIQVTGMNRDNAMSKFEPTLTYENKNIRIHYNKNELFAGSVSNEIGHKLFYSFDNENLIILGHAVYQDNIILFAKGISSCYIYKIKYEEGSEPITLYESDSDILNWKDVTFIETILHEESSDVVKVYWIDGINQLRSINIVPNETYDEDYSFDALPKIKNFGKFEIKRSYGGGEFPAGTIQYCATYINANKVESNIIWHSPLYYISFADRAGKPNEIVNIIFNINATELDGHFEKLRLFSLIRTSTDTLPKAKCLGEFKIEGNKVSVVDYNTTGYEIDPYELLYKNRRYVVPKTFSHKDGTLFLGNFNYTKDSYDIPKGLWDKNEDRTIPLQTEGFCYESLLDRTNEGITYLKKDEVYYLGYQYQDQYGWWSEPIFTKRSIDEGENENDNVPKDYMGEIIVTKNSVTLPTLTYSINGLSDSIKRIRPVISYPNYFEYKMIAQGPLFPTIFNPIKRKKGLSYAEHSWFSRPHIDYDVLDPKHVSLTFPECYQMFPGGDQASEPRRLDKIDFFDDYFKNDSYYAEDYLFGKEKSEIFNGISLPNDYESLNNRGTWAEFRHYCPLPSMWHKNCEVDGSAFYRSFTCASDSKSTKYVNDSILRNNYHVDRSILTLHSPDIVLSQYTHGYLDECYFNVIGDMKLSSFYFDIDIIHKQTTPLMSWCYENKLNVEKVIGKGVGIYKPDMQAVQDDNCGWKLGLAGGYWIDAPVRSNRRYNHSKGKWFDRQTGGLGYFMYTLYPFQKGGCLNENVLQEADDKGNNKQEASSYSWKRTSNIRIANINTYKDLYSSEDKIPIYIFNSEVDTTLNIKGRDGSLLPYKGNQNMTNLNIVGASFSNESGEYLWRGNARRYKTDGKCYWKLNRNYVYFPQSVDLSDSPQKCDDILKDTFFLSEKDEINNYRKLVIVKAPRRSNTIGVDFSLSEMKNNVVDVTIYDGDSYNLDYLCQFTLIRFNDDVTNRKLYKLDDSIMSLFYPSGAEASEENTHVRASVIITPLENINEDTTFTLSSNGVETISFDENFRNKVTSTDRTYDYYLAYSISIGLNNDKVGSDIPDSARKIDIGFNHVVFIDNNGKLSLKDTNYDEGIFNEENFVSNVTNDNKVLKFDIGNLEHTHNLYENLVYELDAESDSGIVTGSSVMSSGKIPLGYDPDFSEHEAFNSMSRALSEIYYNADSRTKNNVFGSREFNTAYFNKYTTGLYNTPSSSEGVIIKAKSTAHAVINLESIDETNYVLPYCGTNYVDSDNCIINPVRKNTSDIPEKISKVLLKPKNNNGTETEEYFKPLFTEEFTEENPQRSYGYYYIGEITKDPNINTSEDAIRDRVWSIGGEAVDVDNNSATIKYTAGDFYYQRYDCLNTQEWGQNELNGNVEIISFMAETRFNLDGRYDVNRGKTSNIYANNNNFNLFNPAYTQQNNFFSYFITKDRDKYTYPNYITWTLTKINGEEIDSWSKIDTISSLQLDGKYGDINSLQFWNNEIVAFQDTGIAQVLYNSRTVITPSQGVPLEVANSGKVDGKTYLSSAMGCLDKRLIANSGNILYFVDSYKNDLWSLSAQGPVPISQTKGFYSWTQNNKVEKVFYVQNKKDIWFNTSKTTLAYSEPLDNFVSFYDYQKTEHLINILGDSIACTKDSLYIQNQGDPCKFFGSDTCSSFYIDMVIKDDGYADKVFDNIEFRGEAHPDMEKYNLCPFDHIEAHNEYQKSGSIELNIDTNLKQKFRIWRANIPRCSNSTPGRIKNRMRSPWIRLKLSNEKSSSFMKDEEWVYPSYLIHDFLIYYTD